MEYFPSSLVFKRRTKLTKRDFISTSTSKEVHFEKINMICLASLVVSSNNLCEVTSTKSLLSHEVMDAIMKLTHKIEKKGNTR